MYIFVYGSLMKGESNYSFLSDRSSEYVKKAVTKRGFTLYDLGDFPGMVRGGTGSVIGEIHKVSAFTRKRLDQLEGHPQLYRRHIIKLQCGTRVEAYILGEGFVRGRPIIESGDWRDR